jgi:hypothetical protein
VYTFAKGEVYSGDFKDGWMQGTGTYTLANDTIIYTGQWYKSKKHGIGEYRLTDGSIYRGSFEDGKFNGFGLQRHPDNNLIQGNYKNNQRIGLQLITDAETGDIYETEFKDDYAEGLAAYHEGEEGTIWLTLS